MSRGKPQDKKEPPDDAGGRREGCKLDGYTDYGYELDGVEYATIDEAYEDRE